jgi:hypothetical protein
VEGFDGLTAVEARRAVFGTARRVILTHSPTLHKGQTRGLSQTIFKAGQKLDELAATLARGKTRRTRGQGPGRDRQDLRRRVGATRRDHHPDRGHPGRTPADLDR